MDSLFDMKFDFGGDEYTYAKLLSFHRNYVDDDYPFEEWFQDGLANGTIRSLKN